MKEEKMMILAMLEEGKITSEVAIKLIEALEDGEIPKFYEESEENENYDHKEKTVINPSLYNGLENLGSDIGNAITNMFDGLRDINYSLGFRNNQETVTEDLDLDLDFENPSLDLKAINGSIMLKPTNSNKLKIKALCHYRKGFFIQKDEKFYNFSVEKDKITFSPKYNNNMSVTLEVSLPKKHFNEVVLNSTNGRITLGELDTNRLTCITTNSSLDIANVNSHSIDLITKNGRIECRGLNSDTINAHTKNSNVFFTNVDSPDMDIKTTNAKIELDNIDTENITCKTSNGNINVSNTDINRVKEMKLFTSNGSISSDINGTNRQIHLDLETSMGNIHTNVPNLVYKVNKQVDLGIKKIIAYSSNFNEAEDHLKFIASTSNGSIKIY